MKPTFFQSTHTLKHGDFFLLAGIFHRLVEDLLPVSATVLFWSRQWDHQQNEVYTGPVKNWQNQLYSQCESLEPGYLLGMLVIPLVVDEGSRIAVLVQDVDPALVQKMDPEWLCELRDSIQLNMELKRQEYVDSVTGLYNNRLLTICLGPDAHLKPGVLFLIGTGNRTRRVTVDLMKVVQTGRFIESTKNGTVFYLGGNIFAVLHANMSRQESLDLAHRLLSRLKREGMHNVHIGISQVGSENQEVRKTSVLNECWQALEAAELRGPFSLCEASFLRNRARHPLARPQLEVLSLLRRKWKGLKQFGLILVRVDNAESGSSDTIDVTKLVSSLLPEALIFIPVSWNEEYILVSADSEKQTVQAGKKLGKRLARNGDSLSFSLGVCHWPTLNYSKTEMTVNCRKALMHGSFFGPGTVTAFDHVSLNVSGDYFFDEGDYRQAVKDYRLGYRMAPDDINLMNSLGVALIELNGLREAVCYFNKVLDREPDNFMALVNKGFALRMVGNDSDALTCFERASQDKEFQTAAVFSDISFQLGRLYCDNNNYGKAIKVLEVLARQKTGKPELSLFRLLGEAYAGYGENKKAMMLLQRAVRSNPHDALSLSILGVLYALEDQGDAIALSYCEQAVEVDDGPWKYWYRLAMVRHKMGCSIDALAALQKCLRRDRKAVEALYLAGAVYEQLGEQKKSDRMFQRVVQIEPKHKEALTALNKSTGKQKR